MLISIHIPKTAGTSFLHVLSTIYGDKLIQDYEERPISPEYQLKKFGLNPFQPFNFRLYGQLLTKQCIHGHFQFAKYAALPTAKFITWLRDPVARTLSHYYYWQRNPDPLNALCVHMHTNQLSLLDFAKLKPMRNLQGYFLSHKPLNKFLFVGIMENFEESLQRFNAIFSHDFSPNLRLNANPSDYDVESSILEKIRDINLEDMHLYDAARSRHETELRELIR